MEAERESAAVQIDFGQTGPGPGAEPGLEGVRGRPDVVAFAGPAFACTGEKALSAAGAQGAVDASAFATWTWPGWPGEASADALDAGPDAG